jgi:hypothetical protein
MLVTLEQHSLESEVQAAPADEAVGQLLMRDEMADCRGTASVI